jgi:tRNA pseudouridine38-40 synthase
MHEALVERHANMVVFTFRANAFLHHMVRNLVGSLVYIGAGREEAAGWPSPSRRVDRKALLAPTFAAEAHDLADVEY